MLLLGFSLFIYLVPSIFLSHYTFQRLRLGKLMITFFMITYSLNILIFQLLGLIGKVDQQWLFIILQIMLCAAISIWVYKISKIKVSDFIVQVKEFLTGFEIIDFVLIGVVCFILGGFYIVGITTPPNNIDSLHAHLPRIFYWLQHSSFRSWPALSHPQVTYPINAHIQGLWLFLLARKENFFFLAQWFSLLITVVTIYEIARLLNFTITQSIISSLILLSFPVALLQSYSFQGDLTVTALVLISIYLIFAYLKNKKLAYLISALLPMALALGTKQTALFVLPVFVAFMVHWIRSGKILKPHVKYLSLVIAFFLIFSSFKYIQNLVEFKSVFGQEVLQGQEITSVSDYISKVKYNAPRLIYNFISFDGMLLRLESASIDAKARIFGGFFSWINLDLEDPAYLQPGFDSNEQFQYFQNHSLNEDTAWFGPLSFLLLPLAAILAMLNKNKEVRQYLGFSLAVAFIYFVIICIQRPGWDPYQGRYFLLGLAPMLPLVAIIVPAGKKVRVLVASVLAVCVFSLAINTLLFNASKPLVTQRTGYEWQNRYINSLPEDTKIQKRLKYGLYFLSNVVIDSSITRQRIYASSYYERIFYNNSSTLEELEFIQAIVPEEEPMYLMMPANVLEYSLFGKNKTRDLFPISAVSQVPSNAFLLINKSLKDINLADFTLLASNGDFEIYKKRP